MIKLPEQSGVENLKAAQVYDVSPPGLALMSYMPWNGSLKQGCTFRLFFAEICEVCEMRGASMQESTESDELYEEDTDSISPARLAQASNARAEESNGIATKVDAPKPLPMASQA